MRTVSGFGFQAAFGIALILFIGLEWYGQHLIDHSHKTLLWVAHTQQVRSELNRYLSVIKDVESGTRGDLLGGEGFLPPYVKGINTERAVRGSLRTLTADNPEQQLNLDDLEARAAVKLKLCAKLVESRPHTGIIGPKTTALLLQSKSAMEAVSETITKMQEVEVRLLAKRTEESLRLRSNIRRLALPATMLDCVILITGFILMTREIALRGRHARSLLAANKQLDQQVNERTAKLQDKCAEMERFTNAVSHDLKSPLVTIKTFLTYLEKDMKANKSESITKDLGFIHSAADKMTCLLEELLKLARVGYTPNAHEDVFLQDVVREALALVAGQIAERGVHVEVSQEAVMLYGDRARLVEAFQNLIDNSIKFLGEQAAPQIIVGAELEGGEVVLFVRDNGKGIDLRHQVKVFDLFEKLDAHAHGSGMGLALVRRIVEMHGGKIWVVSEGLGCGATFRFTLSRTRLGMQ